MDFKLLGGILLVIGTTVGGGMLALPITSAGEGFGLSTVLLILSWLAMVLPAFLVLEVNLWFPKNTNIISMAKVTLGETGAALVWFAYLVLLYCLLSAYIASGSDVFQNLLLQVKISLPSWVSACLFVLIFGFIVYKGMQSVDYVNRGLMVGKLLTYILLVIFAFPFIQLNHLTVVRPAYLLDSTMIIITSFGFATLIPSLRTYFDDDVQKLRRVILLGSVIPLGCYVLWNLAIIGALPDTGKNSLTAMLHSQSSTSDLVNALAVELQNAWVTNFAHLFVSVCVLTAFLAVSFGLTDFLADGLGISKKGKKGVIIYALTFLPPLFVVLFKPGLFITGLNYAGFCCVLLLMFLPVLMAWRGRYHLQMAKATGYKMKGGKILLSLIGMTAIVVMGIGIIKL